MEKILIHIWKKLKVFLAISVFAFVLFFSMKSERISVIKKDFCLCNALRDVSINKYGMLKFMQLFDDTLSEISYVVPTFSLGEAGAEYPYYFMFIDDLNRYNSFLSCPKIPYTKNQAKERNRILKKFSKFRDSDRVYRGSDTLFFLAANHEGVSLLGNSSFSWKERLDSIVKIDFMTRYSYEVLADSMSRLSMYTPVYDVEKMGRLGPSREDFLQSVDLWYNSFD